MKPKKHLYSKDVCNFNPAVRKSAKKTIHKVAKYISRTYVSNQVSDFAYGGIYEFESWYSNMWIDRAFGN